MRKITYIAVVFFLLVGFSGCTIKREVKAIAKPIEKKICIIEDTDVRKGFLQTYVDTLEGMGYVVKVLPQNGDKSNCKITSTYMGRWSWDGAIYLAYAKIEVYEDSKLLGSALYDSRGGDARIFDKFGNGSDRIKSLVEELYRK